MGKMNAESASGGLMRPSWIDLAFGELYPNPPSGYGDAAAWRRACRGVAEEAADWFLAEGLHLGDPLFLKVLGSAGFVDAVRRACVGSGPVGDVEGGDADASV